MLILRKLLFLCIIQLTMNSLIMMGLVGGLWMFLLTSSTIAKPFSVVPQKGIGEFGRGPGQFRRPIGLADLRGTLFVVDQGNRRVQRFGRSTQFLSVFEQVRDTEGERIQMESPHSIAIDPAGRVYISDVDADVVYQFDTEGQYQKTLGGFGGFGVAFNGPTGIDVDYNGYLYVADTGNQRIVKLDGNGDRVGDIRALGGQVVAPIGVKAMPDGRLFVLDEKGITEFNEFGNYLGRLLHYEGATDFDVNASGQFFIASKDHREIVVYSSKGELLERIMGFTATSILLAGNTLYVSDGGRHAVRVFKIE